MRWDMVSLGDTGLVIPVMLSLQLYSRDVWLHLLLFSDD